MRITFRCQNSPIDNYWSETIMSASSPYLVSKIKISNYRHTHYPRATFNELPRLRCSPRLFHGSRLSSRLTRLYRLPSFSNFEGRWYGEIDGGMIIHFFHALFDTLIMKMALSHDIGQDADDIATLRRWHSFHISCRACLSLRFCGYFIIFLLSGFYGRNAQAAPRSRWARDGMFAEWAIIFRLIFMAFSRCISWHHAQSAHEDVPYRNI